MTIGLSDMRRLIRRIGTHIDPKSGKPKKYRRPVDEFMEFESICTLCNFADDVHSIAGKKSTLYCPKANKLLFPDRVYDNCPGGVSIVDIL